MSRVERKERTASPLAEAIKSLPPLPETAQEILSCFGDEFIDAEKIAAVVNSDVGICARLLGLANSAYFGLAEPVKNISDAISRVLGVETVRSLVLAMAIQQSLNYQKCAAFDSRRFWLRSLNVAACCKAIALADQVEDASARDLAYSAGLCHNLGLLALAHVAPEQTNNVLATYEEAEQPVSLTAQFCDELDIDHKIMTAELARIWTLPQPLVAAYELRAFPNNESKERLGLIVGAAIAATENAEVEDEQRLSLSTWSQSLDIDSNQLQEMAIFGPRQSESVETQASNMVG